MPEGLRRYLQPREGWLSAALLMVMLLSLGWCVQRAVWLEQMEFLVPIAFFALLLGTVLALSPLSVTLTLPISAVVGAGIVLWTIGGEYFPELSQGARLPDPARRRAGLDADPGRPRLSRPSSRRTPSGSAC